jgi:hypothetical protein
MRDPSYTQWSETPNCGNMAEYDNEYILDHCATCEGGVGEFRTNSARKEYAFTRMCQKCQDALAGDAGDPGWLSYGVPR